MKEAKAVPSISAAIPSSLHSVISRGRCLLASSDRYTDTKECLEFLPTAAVLQVAIQSLCIEVVMADCLNYQPDSEQRGKVLLVWTHCWLPLRRLSTNVVREVCSYLQRRGQIIGLLGSKIAAFDIEQRSFQVANLSMEVPNTCVFADLSPKSILILGFNSKSVYSLSFPDLQFTPLSDMIEPRGWPGAIRCSSFIYAFGGCCGDSRSPLLSERYSVSGQVWQPLPGMRSPKSHFSPVQFKQHIFLPALGEQSLLESLHIDSLTFSTHCKLPTMNLVSVAAAVGEEIVLLIWEREFRVTLGREIEVKKGGKLTGFSGVMKTKSTPLVSDREMWFMLAFEFTAVMYHVDQERIQKFESPETKAEMRKQ